MEIRSDAERCGALRRTILFAADSSDVLFWRGRVVEPEVKLVIVPAIAPLDTDSICIAIAEGRGEGSARLVT